MCGNHYVHSYQETLDRIARKHWSLIEVRRHLDIRLLKLEDYVGYEEDRIDLIEREAGAVDALVDWLIDHRYVSELIAS